MALIKKLVASARSVVLPALRRTTFFSDGYGQTFKNRELAWTLKSVPHTLLRMAMVTHGDEVPMEVYEGVKQKDRVTPHSNLSIHVPGTAKTHETDQGLRVSLDFELGSDHEFVPRKHQVEYKKKLNALFIKGYLQKRDIRKYYHARVDLPPSQICEPFNTEIKDGVLVVTIPKLPAAGQEAVLT